MPKLRNLVCQVQWADTGIPFKEYATQYGDGIVETYIAVPDGPQPFSIRLTSKAFVHEGLAAAVYVDGHYQVNRNRVNLLPAKKGVLPERTQIDFLFRQKEKSMGDSTYMGRAWRFDNHNIVPTLPEGVTNDHSDNHFALLGILEVIVRRCVARNPDDANASTTSSGAASDIIEDVSEPEDETPAKKDNEEKTGAQEKNKKEEKGQGSAAATKEDDDEGGIFGMMGIFDGPSDYGRHPYSYSDRTFGDWNWPAQSPSHRHHDGYGSEPREQDRWSSYRGPGHTPPTTGRYDPYPHSDCPPSYNPLSHPEKKVHFDYGQEYGPSADHSRYWDGLPASSNDARRPGVRQNSQHAPGLSDWHRQHPDPHDRPQPHPWSHRRDWDNNTYGPPEDPRAGPLYYPNPTHPQHHGPHYSPPNPPPQFHAPTHASHYENQPRYLHPPNAAPPAAWMGAQPMQHWQSHLPYGLPQGAHPSHFGHGNPVYPPYAGTPFRPNANGSVNGGKDGKPFEQAEGEKKLGSLDPAKEENNTKNDGWGTQTNSNGNSSGNNNTQGGWDADQKNDTNNTSNNDGNDWENAGDTKNDSSGWDTNNEQNTHGGWDNNTSPKNNNSWDNPGQAQATNNDWDKPAETNNNPKDNWEENNNITNTSSGNNWSTDTAKAAAPPTQSTSSTAVQALYGPHGAYYAMRSSIDPDVPCDAEEEPRYDVPQAFATNCNSSKQVQPGKGYLYWKKPSKPKYIDTLEEPYAKFVFKYRTKAELRTEMEIDIDTEPSGNEEVQAFQNMNKDDLIRMLLRAKGALGGKIPSPPPQAASNPNEGADKGIAIDPPKLDFLEYDLPSPRFAAVSEVKQAAPANSASNDDWSTPANTASAGSNQNNTNWESSNNNNTSGDHQDWSSRGSNTTNTNTNNHGSGGNRSGGQTETEAWGDNSGDTPKKSSVSSVRAEPAADTNNGFSSEAWDAARKQQQNGPPPAGPLRRESGISPKTKPQEHDAFHQQFSDIQSSHAGYGSGPGYPLAAMPGGWSYGNPYSDGQNGSPTQPEPQTPGGGW